MLEKIINAQSGKVNIEKHFLCPACSCYIGSDSKSNQCAFCENAVPAEDCIQKDKFFLVSSMTAQLIDILQNSDLWKRIERTKAKSTLGGQNAEEFGEFYTGELYNSKE